MARVESIKQSIFFFWKYKKFLLSKLRWVRLYLRKGQEHLGFRSIWIWKTKPNIGSHINFLSLHIWTYWMRVPPHHLAEITQNCGLYCLIFAILTQIYALVGVLSLGRNNVVYLTWQISDLPFEKESREEIGWKGKMIIYALLKASKVHQFDFILAAFLTNCSSLSSMNNWSATSSVSTIKDPIQRLLLW